MACQSEGVVYQTADLRCARPGVPAVSRGQAPHNGAQVIEMVSRQRGRSWPAVGDLSRITPSRRRRFRSGFEEPGRHSRRPSPPARSPPASRRCSGSGTGTGAPPPYKQQFKIRLGRRLIRSGSLPPGEGWDRGPSPPIQATVQNSTWRGPASAGAAGRPSANRAA